MRLIDADKAIEDFAHYKKEHCYDANDLEIILNECPTVSAFSIEDVIEMLSQLESHIHSIKDKSFSEPKTWDNAISLCSCLILDKICSIEKELSIKNEIKNGSIPAVKDILSDVAKMFLCEKINTMSEKEKEMITFHGTSKRWNKLSAERQQKYLFVEFTDKEGN